MARPLLRLGFVGGGNVGQMAHLENYARNPACRLHALAEARPRLRAALQARYGFAKTYASHLELLTDAEVDAVVVVTRREHTGPVALAALLAGKPLFTEKPMCHSVAQVRRLVDAASKSGATHAVGYMRRHDPGIQAALSLLERARTDGSLGKLTFARAHCFGGDAYRGAAATVATDEPYPAKGLEEWPTVPDWLPDSRAADYANFVNVYCHNVNLIRAMFGDAPRVEHVDLSNSGGGLVVLDGGGLRVTLEGGMPRSRQTNPPYSGWDESIEIFFERGWLRLDLPSAFLKDAATTVTVHDAASGEAGRRLDVPAEWAFRRQADAFVQDVLAGRAPIASAVDAARDVALIEEIWKKEIRRQETCTRS